MSVEQQPNGRWRARWRLPGERNPRSKTFTRKLDAERHLARVQVDLERGTYVAPARSHHTVDTYRRDLDRYILPVLGALRLDRLTPESIDLYIAGRLAAGAAVSSVRRERATISRLCSWAVGRRRLVSNPAASTEAPRAAPAEMRFLTAAEVEHLAEVMAAPRRSSPTGNPRYRLVVLVLAWGGLRWSEMVGLRPDDVDGDVVHVRSQLLRSGTEWYRTAPKTDSSSRRVRLPASVAADLAGHIAAWAVDDGPQGPLVFPTRLGGAITYSSWHTNHWTRATRDAGLGHLRPHDLRHTAVALSIAAGAHPKTIQARMGHSSIKVTLDTYGHLFPDLEDTLAEALDDLRPAAVVP